MSAHTIESLSESPNSLAPHYTRFRVADRLLLTGHSHQAWPDIAAEGHAAAFADAAERVDEKWPRAMEQAARVRRGYAGLLGDDPENIALGQNTHEMVVRFLSALPLDARPRLVTTDGEFHTIRRQLDRLAETKWIEVVTVPALPAETLSERLAAEVTDRTAAVLASSVLFGSAHIVPGLERVAAACAMRGAELLIDTYHQLNVVPFSLTGLEAAFIVGGGYKYMQLGEGNCFLRVPPARNALRPILTGWFSEFATMERSISGDVEYGAGPARWAGATYDPVSHYRAARVLDFFMEQALTVDLLREVSQHQVGMLVEWFDALDLDPQVIARPHDADLEGVGGFLALHSPQAGELSARLRDRGVATDFRGDVLRLGPAPYMSDEQLETAMDALGDLVISLEAPA